MSNPSLGIKKFIEKANIVHSSKYLYNDSNYINTHTKITITCPIHGDFLQKPYVHLQGNGCPECGLTKRRSTTEEFVIKATKVHNGFYKYIKTKYINNRTKITITCPIHGDFLQKPDGHLQGMGCISCGIKASMTFDRDSFIEKAQSIHNNKYTYANVVYVNMRTKVTITCPIHGDFLQTPKLHINSKCGCPKCYCFRNSSKRLDIITDILDTHNIKYELEFTLHNIFPECNKLFRMDIYVESMKLFIEYDGSQHFKKQNYHETEEKFLKQCENDNTKNQLFLNQTEFTLLRIKYDINDDDLIKLIKNVINNNILDIKSICFFNNGFMSNTNYYH